MKNIFLTALAMCLLSRASACDICGCSVSNYNPFLFPQLSKGFVGISTVHRSYQTHMGENTASKQHYNSLIVTGQYSIGKNFQVAAVLPYSYNSLHRAGATEQANGLGDISLLLNYKIWERLTKVARQTVTAGAGLKAATGKYTRAKSSTSDDQNFQLGTGSTDYIVTGSYLLSYRKLVFNAATSYKYNTQNSSSYRFGDVLTATATAIYRKDLNAVSIAPYLQVTNESLLKDANNHMLIAASGGNVLYSGGGVDVNTRKLAVGVACQVPVSQTLGDGTIKVRPRISAHLSFTLK